jgi:hypothetical protein
LSTCRINATTRLLVEVLVEVDKAWAAYQNETLRNVTCKRVRGFE